MNSSKVALVMSAIIGKISSFIGYFVGLFSFLIICSGLTDIGAEGRIGAIIFLSMFLPFSIFLIIKGVKIKRRIKRFKRYVSLISDHQMTSLQNIASATSQSVDFVKNDLQEIIDKKFFANASIDATAGEIIIGNQIRTTVPTNVNQSIQVEIESIKCSGCGAVNSKPKGNYGACDYCGSPLR